MTVTASMAHFGEKVYSAAGFGVNAIKIKLEAVSALNPNFTSFMPEFSERFHVMHQAGEAGDWVVAEHEWLELQSPIVGTNQG